MAESESAQNITAGAKVEPTLAPRSWLFVPGADDRKLERAREAGADALILDLEDSVAPQRKVEARRLVVEGLRAERFGETAVAVRINPPATPYFAADLAGVIDAGVKTIMLSKCEHAAAVVAIAEQAEGTRLLLLIETPLGVLDAAAIAAATPSVEALCFGPADFSLAMGLGETDTSRGIAYHARCSIVLAAKAAGVAAIDSVFLSIEDAAAFRKDAELGRALGYDAKLCIHPRQVEIVNDVYTPTADQLERARRIVGAFEQASADGRGVVALDGLMIDAPLVAAQRKVLARAPRSPR
jgi:citrate lyase beta subunit